MKCLLLLIPFTVFANQAQVEQEAREKERMLNLVKEYRCIAKIHDYYEKRGYPYSNEDTCSGLKVDLKVREPQNSKPYGE